MKDTSEYRDPGRLPHECRASGCGLRLLPGGFFGLLLLACSCAAGCSSGGEAPGGSSHKSQDTGGLPDAGTAFDQGGGAEDLALPFDGGGPIWIDAGDAGEICDPQLLEQARIALQIGTDVPPWLASRINELLLAAHDPRPLVAVPSDRLPACLGPGSRILAFGQGAVARSLVPAADPEWQSLGPEGFLLRTGQVQSYPATVALGKPGLEPPPNATASLGASYAAYALLEGLGYAFPHPFAPAVPAALDAQLATPTAHSQPRWPVRGIHLDTVRLSEMTYVVNGWGPGGPQDNNGWEELLPEWSALLEWLLAHRQNRVQWPLLLGKSWEDFADGAVRRERLHHLVELAHDRGIHAGIVVPLALTQQHAWPLIRELGSQAEEMEQLRHQIDFLMEAGFDELVTELGSNQVGAPDDQRNLAWLEEADRYLAERYPGRKLRVRVHCSRWLDAPSFVDPQTDQPLNFNFLPGLAGPRVSVMPHTVQLYSLDDPAPTYNNEDYQAMFDFLAAQAGSRQVIWHPQSAHGNSYDLDVPLFLPLYADRRLHDLRLLAAAEDAGTLGQGAHAGARIQGQILDSGGWEWGGWLNDALALRAAWDPLVEQPDQDQALAAALQRLLHVFGPKAGQVSEALVALVRHQRDLLIAGKVDGQAPETVVRRNGQAYLQGQETWDEVGQLIGLLPRQEAIFTQPGRLDLTELRWPHAPPDYRTELAGLLIEQEARLDQDATVLEHLVGQVPAAGRPLLDELATAARVTALRARQLHGLYDYVDNIWDADAGPRLIRLAEAREALDQAAALVAEQEAAYRVDPARIAAWVPDNPTAFSFGYLWTVRTLYYWWRDEGKAVDAPLTPCYLNVVSPVEVGLGQGFWQDLGETVREIAALLSWGRALADCFADADGKDIPEPVLPPDGLRGRP